MRRAGDGNAIGAGEIETEIVFYNLLSTQFPLILATLNCEYCADLSKRGGERGEPGEPSVVRSLRIELATLASRGVCGSVVAGVSKSWLTSAIGTAGGLRANDPANCDVQKCRVFSTRAAAVNTNLFQNVLVTSREEVSCSQPQVLVRL